MSEYNLYSDFDVEQHKQTYIGYCEAVIFPDGKIEYAVPSHQEKLIHIGAEKYGVSRYKFIEMCPQDRYLDYEEWLCEATGCVALWYDFYRGKPNDAQMRTIRKLFAAGVINPQNVGFTKTAERETQL